MKGEDHAIGPVIPSIARTAHLRLKREEDRLAHQADSPPHPELEKVELEVEPPGLCVEPMILLCMTAQEPTDDREGGKDGDHQQGIVVAHEREQDPRDKAEP